MRSNRSWGVHRGGIGRVQERLLFKERGEQVEESPLTLVEILSRDHGATPLGSRQPSASCGVAGFWEVARGRAVQPGHQIVNGRESLA